MPIAIALRSFDHGGKVTKGDDVSDKFDIITLRALKRSSLISLIEDGETGATPKPIALPKPTVGSLGKAPKPAIKAKDVTRPRVGKKSAASPAVQASLPPTLPPSVPGDLPPPLPVE